MHQIIVMDQLILMHQEIQMHQCKKPAKLQKNRNDASMQPDASHTGDSLDHSHHDASCLRCRNHTGVERIDAGIILGLGESMQESYRD